MSYSPEIKYKEWSESDGWPEKYRSYKCFSPCQFKTKTKAIFDIDAVISTKALDSFISLSKDLLSDEVEIEQKDKSLEVTVEGQSNRHFGLMCMTLLRYVQEYPYVIKTAFENNDLSREAAYNAFVKSHTEKLLEKKYRNCFGHTVMPPPDYCYIKRNPLDYLKVKELIKAKNITSVQGYFSC